MPFFIKLICTRKYIQNVFVVLNQKSAKLLGEVLSWRGRLSRPRAALFERFLVKTAA